MAQWVRWRMLWANVKQWTQPFWDVASGSQAALWRRLITSAIILCVAGYVFAWLRRTLSPGRAGAEQRRRAAGTSQSSSSQSSTSRVQSSRRTRSRQKLFLTLGEAIIKRGVSPSKVEFQSDDAVAALAALCRGFDVYTVATVSSDEEEAAVREQLGNAPVLQGILSAKKCLFCSTANGRAAMARQLMPEWFIDGTSRRDVASPRVRTLRARRTSTCHTTLGVSGLALRRTGGHAPRVSRFLTVI